MSRLTAEQYRTSLETESRRFRDVLADCDPATRVPTCPDWVAADLLWHLGGEVQAFWAWVVANRPAHPRGNYAEPTRPGTYGELLAAFDEGSKALQDALDGADPAEEAWTWWTERTVGFTLRRQALEALVHRVDAELTAREPSQVDPALAADGVDEVLDVMYGGCPDWGSFAPLRHHVRIDLTDTGDVTWVQLGRFTGTSPDGTEHDEDDLHVVEDPGTEPDAVISGTAEDVLLRLWRRRDGSAIHLAGDLKMVDHFRAATHAPIR